VVIGSGRALENIEMLGGFQSQSDD
jgi:hypothetical protein